jgi:putative transposase
MSKYIYKSHNVTVLLYHLMFPSKYRRAVYEEAVDEKLGAVYLEIEKRYEIKFLDIVMDKDRLYRNCREIN